MRCGNAQGRWRILPLVVVLAGCTAAGTGKQERSSSAEDGPQDPRGKVAGLLHQPAEAPNREWLPLAEDGLHDPDSEAAGLLQQPTEALSLLPPDTVGNRVDWVAALDAGAISPRTNLYETTEVQVLDQDVLMTDTGMMRWVRFPHSVHTEWLDCSNCHDQLFARKAGDTPVSMFAILQGEYCGRCHGAVAFPLTECKRCHSVEWRK